MNLANEAIDIEIFLGPLVLKSYLQKYKIIKEQRDTALFERI